MRKFLSIILSVMILFSVSVFSNEEKINPDEEYTFDEDEGYESIDTNLGPVKSSLLHIEGNKIINAEGKQIRLVGACIPSLEWGKGEKNLEESIITVLDNWNANIIRLPVSQKFWYGDEWFVEDRGDAYRRRVDRIVNLIASKGKYVLIDLHEYKIPDEGSVNFWKELSTIYKNHPAVLFDIINETYGVTWKQWRDGGKAVSHQGKNIVSPGMQGLVNVIRENGAKNIIVAGGLDWAYDLRGVTKGYDGLPNGYALDEGVGGYKGNGIMYSSHIYPWKFDQADWEDKVGQVMKDHPIFVGEFGHTNEKVAKFWDNGYYEDASIWCNQLLSWMDANNLNYTIWSFHTNTAPIAIKNWDYEPTPFSGIYQKYNLHVQENHRSEKPQVIDKHPIYTWKYVVDFDKINPPVMVYKENEDDYFAVGDTEGVKNTNGKIVVFKKSGGKSGIISDFPIDWNLAGLSHVAFKIKGDGDMRNIGFGLELKDGRQFIKTYPMNMYQGWQQLFFPIENFKGKYGVIDTKQIKSFFFTNESGDSGSFSIDDFEVGGKDYAEKEPVNYIEDFEGAITGWSAWGDTETTDHDVFTTKIVEYSGYNSKNARSFWFARSKTSFGGQAYMDIPPEWDLKNITHISFMIKSEKDLDLILRLGTKRTAVERSGFNRRDFERFCHPLSVKGGDWQKVTFKIADFGVSETLELELLKFIDIFNTREDYSGQFLIDDLTFSNLPLEINDIITHNEPIESEEIIEPLPRANADNTIFQPLKAEYNFKAGKEAVMNVYVHNATDVDHRGKIVIENLPDGFSQKDVNKETKYVSYARNQATVRLYLDISENCSGEYKIKVYDNTTDLVPSREYTINVTK